MKVILFFIILLTPFFSSAQVKIQNDSLFVYDKPYATYGIGNQDGDELTIDVNLLGQNLLNDVRAEFEKFVRMDIASKPYLQVRKIDFRYRMQGQLVFSDLIEAGELIEDAGRSYNAAIVLNILSSTGGSLLAISGRPIGGTVVAIGGGLIAFIIHVSGNISLKNGGKKLKETGKINNEISNNFEEVEENATTNTEISNNIDVATPISKEELLIDSVKKREDNTLVKYNNIGEVSVGDIVSFLANYNQTIFGIVIEIGFDNKIKMRTYPSPGQELIIVDKYTWFRKVKK